MHQTWQPTYRAPAGAAGGVAGQQAPFDVMSGMPTGWLPGYANALDAWYHQQTVAGEYRALPMVDQQWACQAEYLSRMICACVIQGFLNIQQTSRGPSHQQQPLSGATWHRHRGTGSALSNDPPIALPPVGLGGAFTPLVEFTVPTLKNGVMQQWGVDVTPSVARGDLDFIITVNGVVASPFTDNEGPFTANPGGTWVGAPFTIAAPNRDVVIPLFGGDAISLLGRNQFNAGIVNVAAAFGGWTYPPTLQTSERTIRGTLTDQR